ncbi:A/G-specific adenine glycosylase [Opitutus terrae]|uniref:A/G-specific adenine glycosylase n=1 Tax=Opitutus terrae TaxID=107709 RepID=UPI001ED8C93B|nr:A/G-specific adenine glycosylase [Opitutus terrae]
MPPVALSGSLLDRHAEFQSALLGWYRAHQRRLPWRTEPSLYKTVVSEFMLQQTQVKTVLPYYDRWLAVLPNFAALAGASEAQVLKLWEGLGYYSRARNLHQLSQAIHALPKPPRTPEAWRELPGVGPYTAAAITSIAFGAPAACVDGNVVRILARLTANRTLFRDSASAAKTFTPLAQALLSPSAPGDHNQAMMELGATVCVRQNPLCLTCPVRPFCAAARAGDPESYPRLAPKKMEKRTVTRVWCQRDGALLLHRAADDARRFARMHELPTAEDAGFDPARFEKRAPLVVKRRGITRFQITESIHLAPPPRKLGAGFVWVPVAELHAITLSGPHRRWITEILARSV